MSISTTNYRETYFLKPDLNPIIGKPTFESLYQLIVDLQANAQSVHSNLGGGANGHLGLIGVYQLGEHLEMFAELVTNLSTLASDTSSNNAV